jgi:outer membrane protein OmpA-like peptidoglycan-associated protein
MKKYTIIFLAFLAKLCIAQAPISIVTDESWEVSKYEIKMGAYPMSYQQYQALEKELDKNGQAAVSTKIFDQSKIIPGSKPIWRTKKAQDNWDSYALRKIIPIGNTPIESAMMKINCDDIARVYINGKLLDTKRLRRENVSKEGREVTFEQLSAFMYDQTYDYDIKSYLFTNIKNVIIVELGNETYSDNHAYFSASINVTFAAPKVVSAPEKPKKNPPKKVEKPAVVQSVPAPIPTPVVNQPVVILPAPEVKDMEKLKIGDVMELKDIYFKKDDAVLGDLAQKNLSKLFDFLQKNNSVQIEIDGHTNLIPDEKYCYNLSEKRAYAVKEYLIQRGINADRLQHKGLGKSQPKINAKTPEANQQNQRVEIKILAM